MKDKHVNTWIRFHHFRSGGTLAARDNGDGTADIAVALLHPNDTLDRPLGRRIALGRLDARRNLFRARVPVNELRGTIAMLRDTVSFRAWVEKKEYMYDGLRCLDVLRLFVKGEL